jgi:hypothetical protein
MRHIPKCVRYRTKSRHWQFSEMTRYFGPGCVPFLQGDVAEVGTSWSRVLNGLCARDRRLLIAGAYLP